MKKLILLTSIILLSNCGFSPTSTDRTYNLTLRYKIDLSAEQQILSWTDTTVQHSLEIILVNVNSGEDVYNDTITQFNFVDHAMYGFIDIETTSDLHMYFIKKNNRNDNTYIWAEYYISTNGSIQVDDKVKDQFIKLQLQ